MRYPRVRTMRSLDSLAPLGFRASTGCPQDHTGGIMSGVELLASKGSIGVFGVPPSLFKDQ